MLLAGEIAAYFRTESPDAFRAVGARGDVARALFENAFPGLWDILASDGILAARTRRPVRSARGYAGVLLAALHGESYRLLSLALLQAMHRPLTGAFGEATLMRVVSEPTEHIPVLRVESTMFTAPSPLSEAVGLRTLTPLIAPFSIARELTDAHRELAKLSGNADLLPKSDLPCWNILSVRFDKESASEGMKGRVTVASDHPHAGSALRYALLKGFGARREAGYGSLDIARPTHQRRNTPCA